MTIYFYESRDHATYFMANLPPASFRDTAGNLWYSSEHYFQAQKHINDPAAYRAIISLPPSECVGANAFKIGRFPSTPNPPMDWTAWDNHGSDKAMDEALFYKFSQNPALLKQLVNTYPHVLVEDAGAKDANWGAGADGNGQNRLGIKLMELRQYFIQLPHMQRTMAMAPNSHNPTNQPWNGESAFVPLCQNMQLDTSRYAAIGLSLSQQNTSSATAHNMLPAYNNGATAPAAYMPTVPMLFAQAQELQQRMSPGSYNIGGKTITCSHSTMDGSLVISGEGYTVFIKPDCRIFEKNPANTEKQITNESRSWAKWAINSLHPILARNSRTSYNRPR